MVRIVNAAFPERMASGGYAGAIRSGSSFLENEERLGTDLLVLLTADG